jgi:ABC-type multidrug transport system ATPase subunit
MSSPPPALRIVGLTKSYAGDADDRPALAPLTLDVPPGQRVALVGHNGSGKTTLLRMLAGLLGPSAGHAEIDGHRSGSMEARAAAAYLSDHPTFYDDLSLREHLEFVARLHGVDDWARDADALAERLGLDHRLDELPTTFSRGLRQKAAVTLALVRPFRLLLVDEPFVGLDLAGKEELLAMFREASSRGATLIVATHELSFVDSVDRVLALADGELRFDGTPGDTDVHALVRHG